MLKKNNMKNTLIYYEMFTYARSLKYEHCTILIKLLKYFHTFLLEETKTQCPRDSNPLE